MTWSSATTNRHQHRLRMAPLAVACVTAVALAGTLPASATTSETATEHATARTTGHTGQHSTAQTAGNKGLAPAVTRFGTTVQRMHGESLAAAVKREDDKYGRVGIARLYYSGFPASWKSIKAAVGDIPISISFKLNPAKVLAGDYDSRLAAWFANAPKNRRTFWTYFHEPEDNIQSGEFTARQFRKAFAHISHISSRVAARTHALLRPTLILMCWTLSTQSGRNWRDYYPAGSVKVLGWDCYNYGVRSDTYVAPATLLHRAVNISRRMHLPWALPELGSLVIKGDDGSGRAAWLKRVSHYAQAHNAHFVAYFDTDDGTDYRLIDKPSKRAWAASVDD